MKNYANFSIMNVTELRKLILLSAITAVLIIKPCTAQLSRDDKTTARTGSFQWPEGIKMAISLSFDDARYSQIEQCIPLLDKYNVKGTFYVSENNLTGQIEAWRNAAKNGHDIGNHSLKHSCSRNFQWTREHALEEYSLSQMDLELDSANRIIEEILGTKPVSFAYPCGQTYVGEGIGTKSYVPLIAVKFETGRTWMDEEPNDPAFCNFFQLTGIKLDGKDFEEIKTIIESSKVTGKWLILAGHETKKEGDSVSLTTSLSTIEAICKYASDPANGVWLDNVHNIASYIKNNRK
jgi:peptidoglycan/xylan/chitin deacetylase (PgdA/CDA1 family)